MIDDLDGELGAVKQHADENAQHSRCASLRIDGVPCPLNEGRETEGDIRKVIMNLGKELGVSISPDSIDRTHGVGTKKLCSGIKYQQMIVKFHSFHVHTNIYRARKSLKDPRIYLVLTKTCKQILDSANKYIKKKNASNCFALAEIKCRLCAKVNNDFHYFGSYEEFITIFEG